MTDRLRVGYISSCALGIISRIIAVTPQSYRSTSKRTRECHIQSRRRVVQLNPLPFSPHTTARRRRRRHRVNQRKKRCETTTRTDPRRLHAPHTPATSETGRSARRFASISPMPRLKRATRINRESPPTAAPATRERARRRRL